MIKLPPWVQTNRSDALGSLVGSFGLDFYSNPPNIRTTRTITTQSGLSGVPIGFKQIPSGGEYIYTVAGTSVYVNQQTVVNGTFSVDTDTGTPTTSSANSDIETYNGSLYVTAASGGNGKLYKNALAGSWVNNNLIGTNGDGPWMMTVFEGRLYISVGTLGRIVSTTDGTTFATTGANTLNLGTTNTLRITFLRASSNRIWIGVVANGGNKGFVYEWDGKNASDTVTKAYRLESSGALACVIKDDIPWIMDTNGRLSVFSGGTFKEVARLPLNNKRIYNATATTNIRFIHPNGMTLANGRINLLINNVMEDSVSSIPEFCPSGIWEYDEERGLTHKYALSYLPVGTNTITDYGQNRISLAGGLSSMKTINSAASATGDLLAGATVYTNATATSACTFTNDTFDAVSGTTGQYATQGSGYIVTTLIESPEVEADWQKVFLFYEKLLTSTDSLILKYRLNKATPTDITLTWTSTSTFTTTTNVLGLEGYEVEITQGSGSGKTAHISSIDVAGSTYTIHLDDTFTGAASTAKARIQNWKKAGTIANQTVQVSEVPIGASNPWIQLKLCFLFSGPNEFNKLTLINQAHALDK